MKPISHDEAQARLQAAADGLLDAARQTDLNTHLEGCAACRAYAAEIQALENAVKRTLHERVGTPQLPPQSVTRLVRDVKNNIGTGGVFMKGKSSLFKGIVGLGAAAAAGLCAILGFGSFRAYSQVDTRLTTLSPVTVWFDNPQQGSQLPGGGPVLIAAGASGPHPILYMQLETDGEVVGVIGAPNSQGITPFSANFNWIPDAMKPYTLTARAFDSMGNESDATLFLEIVAPEQITAEEAGAAYAPSGPHAPSGLGEGGGGGGLSEPPDDGPPYEPTPPADMPVVELLGPEYESSKPWAPVLVDWFDFVFSDPDKPAAPGIPATALEGCKPRIWISDNSNNEEGFRVFRRDPGMVDFHEIAVEAAYAGPVFTFEDQPQGLFGTYEYQVSAFNQAGESFSNISEPVVIDSPNCEPDNKLQIVNVNLLKIFDIQSYDMGYCYYSFDGEHWARHPLDPNEFLGPGQAGEVPEGVLAELKEAAQALDLECWGWFGGGLQLVGNWHFDDLLIDHADLGIIQEIDQGFTPYGGGGGGGGPYDPSLPIPYAGLGQGSQDCATFFNMPNPFIKGLICGDVADDIDFVYALYLCIFGPCVPQEDIVGYNFYDTLSGSGIPAHFTEAPPNIYFPIDPSACTPRLIHVTMLVEVDGEIHESLPSNQVIYSPEDICGYLAGTEPRMYRITWESVDFSVGDIDDDPDIEDDAEGFGYLALHTGTGHEVYWHMPMVDGFEDEADENPYFFSGLLLSQHDFPCSGVFCYLGGAIDSSTGNNTANFPLFIGEGFHLTVYLSEYDDDQAHDALCVIDPYTDNLNWNGNAVGGPGWVTTVSRTKHHNYASCRVTVTIEGLP
jgi:hypothetical protein